MKRILIMLCLLSAGYAEAQTFTNYLPLNGTTQFGVFNSTVLSGATVFTVEYWVKTTESGTNGTYWQRPTMFGACSGGNSSGDFGITTNNGYIGFWHGLNTSGDQYYLSPTVQINNNAWHHVAVVNDGMNATLYVDGISLSSLPTGTGLVTANTPLTVGGSSLDFGQAGNNTVGVNFFHEGQYAEMRVSVNVRYTGNFTPATSFSTDANTISLLHYSGQCGIKALDASVNANDLIANNATVACAPLPFTNDFSFDGATQYGITPAGLLNGLSTFTIEGWIKSTDVGVTPNGELWRAPNIVGNASNGNASGEVMVTTQAGYLTLYTGLNTSGDNAFTSRAFVSDNQWHHWAVSANGTTAMLFADGIKVGSLPINRTLATSGNDALGIMTNNSSCCGGPIYKHSGELDEVRFSNTARYTANFTPLAGTFSPDAATVALYHLNGFNCLSLYTPDASGNNDSMLVYGYAGCLPNPAYPVATAVTGNITNAEYFIDTDPGFGNGISFPAFTAAVNISALSVAANTVSLSPGIHRIYVRSKNAAGSWSITNERDFLVSYDPPYGNATPAVGNVVKAEYYIDTDPGFGNGSNFPAFTAGVDIASLTTAVNTSALIPGIHRLYARSKNAAGSWSITNARDFLVSYDPPYTSATPAAGNITKAEYFIDTDPGFGNGVSFPAFTAALNITGLTAAVGTSSLAPGVHRIYVRSSNAAGHWSITNERDFLVDDNPAYPAAAAAPGNITKMEYFFDTDPGFGLGNAISVTPAVDIANMTIAVNTGSLSAGTHHLYIRSFDDWSVTSVASFSIVNPLPVTWTSFAAVKKDASALLNWSVANEQNCLKYDVERSGDGQTFNSIGSVNAKKASGVNDYAYADLRPLAGNDYYRIRQVDISGGYSLSDVKQLHFNTADGQIALYPNPASDFINVSFTNNVDAELNLYAPDGKLVWSKFVNGTQAVIPTGNFADGIYQLSANTKDGSVITEQIAIRH